MNNTGKTLLISAFPGLSDQNELLAAVEFRNIQRVKALLDRGANVNQTDLFGWTPLYWAANQGYAKIAKMLLEAGADVNQADNNGWTPLHVAADDYHRGPEDKQAATEVAKVLLKAGADVNQTDNNGETPLYVAAYRGHRQMVVLLLKAGADPNRADNHGKTPQQRAAEAGKIEMSEYLERVTVAFESLRDMGALPPEMIMEIMKHIILG